MDYIAYLHKDRDSDFGVSFPDFPGCIAAGKTLEEARVMAVEALAVHIAGMMDDGESVPEPSTLDSLVDDEAMKGAVAFLVHMETQTSRTVRINITARENQVEEIDQLAAAAGMTRSAYMVQSSLGPTAVARRPSLSHPLRAKRARELSQQVHRHFQNQVASSTTSRRKKA